ncbi:preprotein translocase subunit SecG, partial [Clostridium botulinum]|nr:preprotein translocase subunit SecG [Clostridium botulinum]
SKNRTRTSESVLSRITVVCSILFAIIVLAQNYYLNNKIKRV